MKTIKHEIDRLMMAQWIESQIWIQWLRNAEMAVCNHRHMEVDANVGPESGIETFYCKRCGYTNTVIYY